MKPEPQQPQCGYGSGRLSFERLKINGKFQRLSCKIVTGKLNDDVVSGLDRLRFQAGEFSNHHFSLTKDLLYVRSGSAGQKNCYEQSKTSLTNSVKDVKQYGRNNTFKMTSLKASCTSAD